MKRLFGTLVLLLLVANSAHADAFEEEVRALLSASGVMEQAAQQATEAINAQQADLVDQLLTQYQAAGKDVTRDDVVSLVTDFRVEFLKNLVVEIEKLMVAEYRGNFTLEEIKRVRELIQDPAMIKFNTRSLSLMQAAQTRAMQISSNIAADIMQRLISENPKFR